MTKRFFPENLAELKDINDIKSLLGPSELIQLAVEAQGNPAVITLAQPYKMATSVRMVAAIIPACVYSINQYNNNFYFTEMYAQTYSPTLYKTAISAGNYSSDELILALQAAIPAARPVTTTYYNSDVICNNGPPLGEYTVMFDDITSVVAIRKNSASALFDDITNPNPNPQQGMFVHCRSARSSLTGNFSKLSISMGASNAGVTAFTLTTNVKHNINTYALINFCFTNGTRSLAVSNYLLTTPPPSPNTIVVYLRNLDVAGIFFPNDNLVVTSIDIPSDSASISPCLGFARPRDGALVASGRQALPLQVISSNVIMGQTGPTNQAVFTVDGAHFLQVGDVVTGIGTDALVGPEFIVDEIDTSSTFKAHCDTTGPLTSITFLPKSFSLKTSQSPYDALIRASDRIDVSLHTRSIYVDLQLGSTQVGSMHSTRIGGRRYIGKIQMDATENGIVFEQHPQVRAAIPLRNSTASFQTVTITLYDAQEIIIDMPNVCWSCMVELEART